QHGTVGVEELSASSEHDDVMRNEIEDLSQLVFLPRDSLRFHEVLILLDSRRDRLRGDGRFGRWGLSVVWWRARGHHPPVTLLVTPRSMRHGFCTERR